MDSGGFDDDDDVLWCNVADAFSGSYGADAARFSPAETSNTSVGLL